MNEQLQQTTTPYVPADDHSGSYDYANVTSTARIACYDDLRSAPRIIEVPPASTADFIESLASGVYSQAQNAGGTIPYTVIREVAENFIHAQFSEIIVSILDNGNTIRFADQGPGISEKEKAQLPGFSSATEPMKPYIRGVGSGLPIVKEYLNVSHGTITIEDNLKTGAVVTISMIPAVAKEQQVKTVPVPPLTSREQTFLSLLHEEGSLGVTDLSRLTDTPASTTHVTLKKLEEAGLVEKTVGQKRILTDLGNRVANTL